MVSGAKLSNIRQTKKSNKSDIIKKESQTKMAT